MNIRARDLLLDCVSDGLI